MQTHELPDPTHACGNDDDDDYYSRIRTYTPARSVRFFFVFNNICNCVYVYITGMHSLVWIGRKRELQSKTVGAASTIAFNEKGMTGMSAEYWI